MTLRNRFLLVGFGAIVFAISTPVIVLYALGYKFDLRSRQVLKTGTMVVYSEPNDANIYIDDKIQKSKTDATIRFLLPGDFNIKVSKPGYQSWTKRLNVRSSLVTWANYEREYITLFFDDAKEEFTREASMSAVSVRENNAVVSHASQLFSYNPNRGEFEQVSRTPSAFASPISLASEQMGYYLLRHGTVQAFTPELLATAKQIESNDNYAALLTTDNELYRVKDGTLIKLADGVSGFALENEHVWYVQETKVNHANLALGVIDEVSSLPYSPISSTVIRGQGRIFLIMDQTLYALNDKAEEIYRGVTYAYWSSQAGRLVFANNNEALLFDPGSFRSELIIRSSTPIRQPIVNTTTGYLFFLNENRLKAIELDGRDHRNVYTLAATPARSFLVSDDGKLVTLFTDTGISGIKVRD
jgi:hypothetical protein